jgi:hypothetical protein
MVWWHTATLLIYFYINEQSYNIYIPVYYSQSTTPVILIASAR